MKLADRHGKPLSQVLAEYPAWELPYWQTYYALDPPPEEKLELIVAKGICLYANANSGKGKRKHTPSDYMYPDMFKKLQEQDNNDTIRHAFAKAGLEIKRG